MSCQSMSEVVVDTTGHWFWMEIPVLMKCSVLLRVLALHCTSLICLPVLLKHLHQKASILISTKEQTDIQQTYLWYVFHTGSCKSLFQFTQFRPTRESWYVTWHAFIVCRFHPWEIAQGNSKNSYAMQANFISYCLFEGAPYLLPLSAQTSGHLKEVEKA